MLHSPTMPRWRTTLMAVVRSMWYSASVSVCDGAMTMESPVWTPRGSKFSMLHTVMQLLAISRTTSYSTSFQPLRDFSTSTCGLDAKASRQCASNLSLSSMRAEPRPPSAKAQRTMHGKPIFFDASIASSSVSHANEGAMRSPISLSLSEKMPRSSVASMDATDVPSTRTPYFSRMPRFSSSTPQLRPVWPPIERMMPSGFSRAMISSTYSGVTGSRYTRSAGDCPWPSTLV
mmetsp:Transcript_32051/g.83914  ORF Transcript_32051/g.83914 Transcript_32051/m.83914 type:complete len:232 (+) Transcript_32051:3064-3759(+)